MSLLPIITVPAPVLKQIAQPVETINPLIRQQAADMLETMYVANGVGLAANQVNSLHRMLVMDVQQKSDDISTRKPLVMINPEIIWASEEKSVFEEGCLSIPQQYAEVTRSASVRVKYLDVNSVWHEEVFENGLPAHCVQHEIDHLNGVLFIDYLSSLKRNLILSRVKKLKDRQASVL